MIFNNKKRGASLTGYGLIIGLIAVVGIVSIQNIGSNVSTLFNKVGNNMEEVANGTSGSTGGGTETPTPPATDGYFVLSAGFTTGSVGGLAGADSFCQTELTNNDWLGKDQVADCTASSCPRAQAFLCDSATCTNLAANTTFNFASANSIAIGGASFTTDASGIGPGDGKNWSDTDALGAASGVWYNRGTTDASHWANTPDDATSGGTCGDWTNTTGVAFFGDENKTDALRWSTSQISCAIAVPLICFINP